MRQAPRPYHAAINQRQPETVHPAPEFKFESTQSR